MNRSEIFSLLRQRWGASLVVAGYVLGAGYVLATPLLEPAAVASSPPGAVRHLGARLEIVGKDVSRAGGVSVALDHELLQLRQTCAEACDRIVVSYPVSREGLYRLRVEDRRGECILCEPVYSDGNNDDRLALGADGGLALAVRLVGY